MIIFDSKFRRRHRDAVRKARAERIRCIKLRDGLYYVARQAKGHGEYLVQVDLSNSSELFATCRTIRGLACPHYGVCAHVAKVYESMVREARRELRKERAA